MNLDFTTPFPPSTAYNVTVRPVAADDYVHLTAAANVNGNSTTLTHPLLDGNPDAVFQVSHYWGGGANERNIGVWYDGSKWRIFNQAGTEMPSGRFFFVSID